MTNRMITSCLCALMMTSALAAQTNMDKKMMGKEMKVTGCVASGEMGHYMLNNAMMSPATDMKKDSMMKDDMKPMSYMLMGSDMKAHMGHKVEVTGMMADEKSSTMAKGKDAMGKDMAMPMLTVKSVKMMSATCP